MLNIKKIKPMANYIVTTMYAYTEKDFEEGKLITELAGKIKEFQTVVAVGPMIRNIKEGDLVCINPKRYARYKHQEGSLKDGVISDNPVISYNFNIITLDHNKHLLLTDQDIEFVIEEYEEEEKKKKGSKIIVPSSKLII